MSEFYFCPMCAKKGVTFRMKVGGDFVACRYCEFYAYSTGYDRMDVEARAALAAVNPSLKEWFADDTEIVARWNDAGHGARPQDEWIHPPDRVQPA